MKRVIALLLCLMLVVSMFVACDEIPTTETTDSGDNQQQQKPGQSDHTHTFSTTWSSDAEGHWYDATCECEDVSVTKLAHADANNDGACDVCTYTDHEHTYSEEWTIDCTNHWHAADCGHIVAGTDVAAHVDENTDGKCDVCTYIIEDIHKHYYATEWSSDAENHWHAALCEHSVEVADKAAHNLDAAGYCTVCDAKLKEIDKTDIKAVLEAAIARNYKVISGGVLFSEVVFDSPLDADVAVIGAMRVNEVDYILGNDASYLVLKSFNEIGECIGIDQQWYSRVGADDYFGVELVSGTYQLAPVAGSAQHLNGYNYTPGNLLSKGYEDTTTLAQTLANMVNQMTTAENVSNVQTNYNAETGEYSFSYTIFMVDAKTTEGEIYAYDVEQFTVLATFTVDDNFVVNVAEIAVASFRNWEMDMDLEYDPTTNKVTMLDSATATVYTYSVGQVSGERTYTSIYSEETFTPVDFELSYVTEYDWANDGSLLILSEQKIEDKITVEEGTYIRLHLIELLPHTALTTFLSEENFKISYENKAGAAAGQLWLDSEFTLPTYSAYSGCIAFAAKNAGSYVVTISFGELTKTVEFEITAKPIVNEGIPAGATSFKLTPTDTYTLTNDDDKAIYTATVAGTYTFTVPANFGIYSVEAYDAFSIPEVDLYDGGGSFSVELDEGETFEFFFGGITKDEFTVTVSINEGGAGGGEGDLPTFDYNTIVLAGPNTLYFSAAEVTANAATRQMTITAAGNYKLASGNLFIQTVVDAAGNTIAKNEDYSYTLAAGTYTLNFAMLSMFGVKADTACTLNVECLSSEGGEEGGEEGETDLIVPGTYTGTDAFGNSPLTITVDGNTVTFVFTHPLMGTQELVATYTISAGVVTLYDEDGAVLNPLAGSITIDENNVPVAAEFNGNSYTIGDDDGGNEEDPIEPSITIYDEEENTVTVTEDDVTAGKLYVSFMPFNSGEYTFSSNDFYISAVLDAEGNLIERNDNWCYVLEMYETYTIELNTSYLSAGAGDYTVTPEYQYPLGHQNNPDWYTVGEEATANYKGDYSPVWFKFYANATGTLTLTNLAGLEGVTLMITTVFGNEITNVTYDENYNSIYANTITLDVVQGRAYYIGIAAFESEEAVDITFKATIAEGEITTDGTVNIPHNVIDGENTVTVPAWENVYYAYKFPASGTVTFTTNSTNCTWYVTNDLSVFVEGVTDPSISYEGYEGETIYICVTTTNWEEDTIVFTTAFKAAPTEVYYENAITDGSAANAIVIDENSYVSFFVNSWDSFTITWDNPNAIIEIVSWGEDNASVTNGSVVAGQMYFGLSLKIYFADYAAGTVNVTLTPCIEEEGGEGESGDDTTGGSNISLPGSGTSSDPYVIETLPLEMSFDGNFDVYVKWTATEACVLTITYTDGALVSDLPEGWEKDAATMTYTLSVSAGDVLVLNLWTMRASGAFEYTFSIQA